MKNTAINTISYTGIVTLSQRIGTKKTIVTQVHNAGGSSLFNFLANCLSGHFSQVMNNWPTKIKILEYSAGDSTASYDYSSVSGFIFLNTEPEIDYTDLSCCRVRYSFMVPRDLLENITGNTNLGLGLYTHGATEDEPENFAAFCQLGTIDRGDLINASLIVDWDLIISNAGTVK